MTPLLKDTKKRIMDDLEKCKSFEDIMDFSFKMGLIGFTYIKTTCSDDDFNELVHRFIKDVNEGSKEVSKLKGGGN